MKEIPLTQGKVAIIDDEDFEWLSQYNWHFTAQGYAARRGDGRIIAMHREIAGTPPGMDTDHANGDKLDNRRSNLRPCTRSENNVNRPNLKGKSDYKGVTWCSTRQKWSAFYYHGGKSFFIGRYAREEDAARAYDAVVKEVFGSFALLNFPNEV